VDASPGIVTGVFLHARICHLLDRQSHRMHVDFSVYTWLSASLLFAARDQRGNSATLLTSPLWVSRSSLLFS
jgi:hypothetical protein